MNLIIDIGNTRVKAARMEQGEVREMHTMSHELEHIEDVARGCDAAIVSSVASKTAVQLGIPVLALMPDTPLPICVEYGSRSTLGADRVAAAVGAWRLCPERPALVIDSGTCITIDLVLPGRGFVGGNISAGIDMRLRACHEFTGRLPLASSKDVVPFCPDDPNVRILGTSTQDALINGAMFGASLEIEGYVRTFASKYRNLAVIMTGGAAINFDVPEKVPTFVRPYLVAEGLDAILEYNKSKQCN